MRLNSEDIHLTYCLNAHPGESWEENIRAIRENACAVRDIVCPGERFGLGLRLGKQAVDDMRRPRKIAELTSLLERENLYVFTVNAFPYGTFHTSPVKENVYRPDWTEPARVDYTIQVARILSELLPEGVAGSVSTVPVSYKGFRLGKNDLERACASIAHVAKELAAIHARAGKHITLALEPEPDCVLETIDECVAFYQDTLIPGAARNDCPEHLIRRHIGICFDTAHAAVEFEPFIPAMEKLRAAGIPIAKIQISSALTARGAPESLAALRPFREPVYLHQTRVRDAGGAVARFADLPEALATLAPDPGQDWRVHYHVPLFWRGGDTLGSTSNQIPEAVRHALDNRLTSHFEIETYTFTVLPPSLAPETLSDGIAREFLWLLPLISSG
ncbi:MAG: metabolite traffic protein EboE [Lentisphaeria bacterium]|nr:metabolite traffic protein EboE [Lentisphaeria bacterium]